MSEAESEPSLLSCIRIRKIARSAPAVLRAERACQFLVASLNPPAVDAIPDQSILASNLYQELAPTSRHRYVPLQRELEQSLAWHFHLVSLRDDFRTSADARTDARTDRRTFAAAGNGTNDRSCRRPADCSRRCTGPAGLAAQFIIARHNWHGQTIHDNPGQLEPQLGSPRKRSRSL